ncbi:MAG: response regulator [Verrucomicrobia bacterium]|nr:response regulator [Verrucomicrobiota bacterium]
MSSVSVAMDPSVAKILVVDDEPMILSVLKEQLQPEGFNATFVDSAAKALDALKRESFSIILADHEMPGMTGLELLGKVRESHPDVIRLMLSGQLEVKELLDAVQSGVIHRYLTKPWLLEELLVVLRNSVARKISASRLEVGAPEEAEAASATEAAAARTEAGAAPAGLASADQADCSVEAFLKILSEFHPNLGNTATRAMALCKTVGEQLSLPASQAQSLIWAAALHDIALVGVDRPIVRRWLRSPD